MMAPVVYSLCVGTSLLCAYLLFKGFFTGRNRLLLWTAACFLGFALNNLFLLLDIYIYPSVDLMVVRALFALVGLLVLVYGLIREATF